MFFLGKVYYRTGDKFFCSECGRKFNHVGNVKKHYNMVHMHQEPVTCQYCDKQFQHSYSLSSHIYRKHERHMKMMPKMTEKENINGNDISSFLRKHNICD